MAVADGTRKPLVKDLHDHIVCPLCRGYLIDATTLVECLHSFCRGCIVRRLGSGARACPVCGALTLPPLLPDLALQHLVYLAVPGLYRSELERRRHFRLVNPQCPPPAPPLGGLALTLDDAVSLSLCEIVNTDDVVAAAEEPRRRQRRPRPPTENGNDVGELVQEYAEEENSNGRGQIRYLKCPAGVTVRHLVRLLALKRGWGDAEAKLPLKRIEMLYEYPKVHPSLPDKNYTGKPDMRPLELSWTLLDLACIFKWDKETPMKLYYRVVQRSEETILQQQSGVPISLSSYNNTANNNNSTIGNNSNVMENVQRPPTPPPSPKQSSNPEMRTSLQSQPAQLSNTSKPRCKPTIKSLEILKPVSGAVRKVSEERTESEILVENTEETAPAVVAKSLNPISVELPASPQQQQLISSCGVQETVAQSVDANGSPVPSGETNGVKIKKPRCKVTPVMRAPGLQGSCSAAGTVNSGGTESNKSGRKLPRLEHHKRRKRRNKRLIAEITTTPREDLLKLKVRLTPCPPRITSSSGSAKEKLLQMRAVRREKIKTGTERPQTPPPSLPLTPPPSASIDGSPILLGTATTINEETVVTEQPRIAKDSVANAASGGDPLPAHLQEETIEEIIDGIPDEVVRVAQILNKSSGVKPIAAAAIGDQEKCSGVQVITVEDEVQEVQESKQHKKKDVQETAKKKSIFKVEDRDQREGVESATSVVGVSEKPEEKPKDEEVLRRLGLVAISEASKTLQDKIRNSQSSGGGGGASGGIDYHRESLERQLRESKANRVRSLLAEKQMRDALKSIMSKSKPGGLQAGSSNGPKKGPPPLAPLTLKQGFSVPPKSAHPVQTKVNPHHVGLISSSARSRGAGSKIEKPLDLSSGANNALDLSPTPSCSNPVITSTTYSTSPAAAPLASKPTPTTTARGVVGADKSPERDVKKNQDLNLRTLSDAAVSLLRTSPTQASAAPCNPTLDHQVQRITAANNSTNVQSSGNKVALRIPQPHQRISGFGNGMKIKPNLAVRHIPNPQAFVASQYNRNQRTSTGFFNAQQQPP